MRKKIDCSIAVNLIEEFERMCNTVPTCIHCPMHKRKYKNIACYSWVFKNPQKAVEIVQKWSDEHPREKVVTYLDKLLEVFPNTTLNKTDGTPVGFCPENLGLKEIDCSKPCIECWSQPYKEKGNE